MVYDASALLAVALGEPKGSGVRDRLDRDPAPVVSAIKLGETLIVLTRKTATAVEEDGWPRVEPVTVAIVRIAAGLYPEARSRRPKVSLADCIAVATAMHFETKVVTTDGDYEAFDPRWVEILGT